MGNAAAKQAQNGGGRPSVGRTVGSLPESPRWSPLPSVFAPQVPVAPLQRPTDAPLVINHNNSSEPFDSPREKGIPTLITWSHGGKDVLVEGSWNNWSSRISTPGRPCRSQAKIIPSCWSFHLESITTNLSLTVNSDISRMFLTQLMREVKSLTSLMFIIMFQKVWIMYLNLKPLHHLSPAMDNRSLATRILRRSHLIFHRSCSSRSSAPKTVSPPLSRSMSSLTISSSREDVLRKLCWPSA